MVFVGPGPVSGIGSSVEAHAQAHAPTGLDPVLPTIGDIKMFLAATYADAEALNPGWLVMDGTVAAVNGVTPPSMIDRVPIGAANLYAIASTGGDAAQADHAAFTHTTYQHLHGLQFALDLTVTGGGPRATSVDLDLGHTHDQHPAESHGTNLPPYGAVFFLIYVGA